MTYGHTDLLGENNKDVGFSLEIGLIFPISRSNLYISF